MPGSRWARSWPVRTSMPNRSQPARVLRAVPVAAGHLGPPRIGDDRKRRHAGPADPDHVQPAIGQRHRASARSSVAMRTPASGRASAPRRLPHPLQPGGVGQERVNLRREPHGRQLGVGDHDGAAAAGDVLGVARLVVGGDVRRRHEDGRLAGGGDLEHRPARAGHHQVGRGQKRTQAGRVREHPVVGGGPARRQRELALAGDVHDDEAGIVGRPGGDRSPVERGRAEAAAEHEHHPPVGGQVELAPALLGGRVQHRPRHRPAGELVARRPQVVDRERQEYPPRERRRHPVGQAEVCVDLEQRRRDALHRRGGQHRTGHVAAAAEDHVGADRGAGCGCRRRRRAPPGRARARARVTASAAARSRGRCAADSRPRARAAPRSAPPSRRRRLRRP